MFLKLCNWPPNQNRQFGGLVVVLALTFMNLFYGRCSQGGVGWLTFFLIDAPSAFFIAFSFQVKGIPPTTEEKLPELPELCKRRNMLYLLCRHQLTANTQLCICRFIGSLITLHAQNVSPSCNIFISKIFFYLSILLLHINVFNLIVVTFFRYFLSFGFYLLWLFNITFAFAFRGIVHLKLFSALNQRFWIVMRLV